MHPLETHNRQSNFSQFFLPEDGLDFKKIAAQLYQYIWIILGVSCFTAFIALLYTFSFVKQYQSSAILQVKDQSNTGSMMSKMSLKQGGDSQLQSQEALTRTRYILEPVIAENGLNVSYSPHYYPYVGSFLAKLHTSNDIAKPLFGLKKYAWGGEKLELVRLEPSVTSVAQSFRLMVGKNNTYKLYSSDNHLLLEGKAGELAQSPQLQIKIDEIHARPDTEFFVNFTPAVNLVKSLSRRIKMTDVVGNDPMQSTGIFELSLTDSDQTQVIKTLNQIANYIVTKNKQQNAKEAEETLLFLQQRLAEIKNKLIKKEDNINDYHSKNTTLSMAMSSQLLAGQLLRTQQEFDKLKSQQQALLQIYTPLHPLVIAGENKITALQQQLEALKSKVRELPYTNQVEINLIREAKITNSAYLFLLSHQQELEINKAGLTSNVIILSDAMPAVQLPSHKLLTVIAGFLFGLFGSVITILIKNILKKTVESSDEIENTLQIPVRVVLPYSRNQKRLEKSRAAEIGTLGTALTPPLILAKEEPDDITIESLRSLRISLQFMSPQGSHVIAILGSLSNIGKSFVSLNLSQVMADTNKRTILIDGDIRKGRLHTALNKPKSNGLSEYLEEKCSYEDIIQNISHNLCFISCGTYNTHPIQLFQNPRFKELLERLKQDFAQIIIDTPPVIPVTDAILIAQHCDVKLFVVSAGKDTMNDIQQAVKKVQSHHITVDGIVLNHRKSLVPYGSRHYQRYAYGDAKAAAST